MDNSKLLGNQSLSAYPFTDDVENDIYKSTYSIRQLKEVQPPIIRDENIRVCTSKLSSASISRNLEPLTTININADERKEMKRKETKHRKRIKTFTYVACFLVCAAALPNLLFHHLHSISE